MFYYYILFMSILCSYYFYPHIKGGYRYISDKYKNWINHYYSQQRSQIAALAQEQQEFFANPKSDRTKLFLSQIL